MNASMTPGQDPLGLRELPEPQPEDGRLEQDWQAVSAALDARAKNRRRAWAGALATAASIALVVAVLGLQRTAETGPAADTPMTAEMQTGDAITATGAEQLMAMSQDAERQLRQLRARVGSMPSEAVVYQVELQDLIGQVDDALSLSPDSTDLWGQRLSLQFDLMRLYSSQLRRNYVRVASL